MTDEHKIGETATAKLVGGEDFGCLKISDGIRRDVALKISEARSLYAILYEYFGDYWVPCGPDGPFPPAGSEIDITLSYPSGKRVVVREVAADGVDFKGDVLKVVAWKPYLKPYDQKGKSIMQREESHDIWPWRCDDCNDHVDPGKTLCPDCSDRRMEEWREYQDRLHESREISMIIRDKIGSVDDFRYDN